MFVSDGGGEWWLLLLVVVGCCWLLLVVVGCCCCCCYLQLLVDGVHNNNELSEWRLPYRPYCICFHLQLQMAIDQLSLSNILSKNDYKVGHLSENRIVLVVTVAVVAVVVV